MSHLSLLVHIGGGDGTAEMLGKTSTLNVRGDLSSF